MSITTEEYNLSACRRALYNQIADVISSHEGKITAEVVSDIIRAFEDGANESGKQYAVIVTLRN